MDEVIGTQDLATSNLGGLGAGAGDGLCVFFVWVFKCFQNTIEQELVNTTHKGSGFLPSPRCWSTPGTQVCEDFVDDPWHHSCCGTQSTRIISSRGICCPLPCSLLWLLWSAKPGSST